MACVTPKKVSSDKLSNACRCCYSTSIYRVHLFGEKALEEKLVSGIMKLVQIRVDEQDQLPQYVCARKISSLITKLAEFKKICWESATKQKEDFESARVKRGRKDASSEIVHSPIIEQASKKSNKCGCTPWSLERTFQQILPKPIGSVSATPSISDQIRQPQTQEFCQTHLKNINLQNEQKGWICYPHTASKMLR